MASTKPAEDACLLVPLKAPSLCGTLEDYLSTCVADRMRHARRGLLPMAPLGSSQVAHDAPLSVKPPAIASSRPKPKMPVVSVPAGKDDKVVQAGTSRLADRRKEIKQLLDLDISRFSAGLGLARIVDPMKAEVHRRTGTATSTAGVQKAHRVQDALSLMPLFPYLTAKLYTIRTKLDLNHHPHHPHETFRLGIDTASLSSWAYGPDFQQIPSLLAQRLGYLEEEDDDGDDDQDEGEDEVAGADEQEQEQEQAQEQEEGKEDEEAPVPDTVPWHIDQATEYISGIHTLMPVYVDGKEVHFPTSGAPQGPNEWPVDYEDGSALYLRHIPNSFITTRFPCWSWKNNDETTCRLALQSVLAFGANHYIISLPPVDGLIGLGVPNVRPLAYHDGDVSERTQFFDALERGFPRVYEPRRFFIKLNHPDVMMECEKNDAIDFMYMGTLFPCILKPVFTPKLAVYAADVSGSPCDRTWMLGMRSMSLLVPDDNNGFSEFKINMVNPNIRSIRASSEFQNMIHVMIDSGTSATFLPKYVHEEIRDNWLCNSPAILDLNPKIQSYCGPERNLDDCEVVFTFIGQDKESVDFRCPAKPFLKSYFPLPSHEQETSRSHYCSNVRHWIPGTDEVTGETIPDDSERTYWVLGYNFYWSAFVEHVGPIKDERTSETDFSHYSEPYVRLAPQRARKPDGSMGYAKDFTFFKNSAPRYHPPTPET